MSAMHQYISAKHITEQQLVIDNMQIINERVQLHINNTKNSTKFISASFSRVRRNFLPQL